MCERVFAGTLSASFVRNNVMLSNGLGAGGRPFTSIDFGRPGHYTILIGPRAFDPAAVMDINYKATFVHEMTHVWQMHVEVGSAESGSTRRRPEACRQGNAYLYGEGNLNKPWDDFGVEEQAQIVEDWFKNGLKSDRSALPLHSRQHPQGNAGYVADTPTSSA